MAVVKPGRILFEMAEIPEEAAREAMRLASNKLPIKCRFVTRRDFESQQEQATKEIQNDEADAEAAGVATE